MFSFRTEVEIVKFFATNKYFLSFKCMTAAVLPSGESVFYHACVKRLLSVTHRLHDSRVHGGLALLLYHCVCVTEWLFSEVYR